MLPISMFVHDQVPPGVPCMRRSGQLQYLLNVYEKTESGARLRIKTTNAEALKAVHDFLRFQIEDHHTGDSLDVPL